MERVRAGDADAPKPSKIIIEAAAKKEIREATSWYEEKEAVRGEDFFSCVQQTLRRIALFPLMAAEVEAGIRRAVVIGYPYSIYHVFEKTKVLVLGLAHHKQDQANFIKRFKRWQQER